MNTNEPIKEIIRHWMGKAREALASAEAEYLAGRYTFAMNRAYYSCFYAATSVLLRQKRKFSKHSGVRSALHREIIKTGLLSPDFGKIYDRLYENRQEGDYLELIRFEKDQVYQAIQDATTFVSEIEKILLDTSLIEQP